ncbi:DUF3298 and DUF4163 domain-containing protein [Candidatus Gracilibacteria bacterium]|nr:DUF3298 and DUF4163 domain-containing protein [Candidatus Gracilibacteria bacterium]
MNYRLPVLTLGLLVLTGCSSVPVSQQSTLPHFIKQSYEEDAGKLSLKVAAHYPEFSEIKNKKTQQLINEAAKKVALDEVDKFKKELDSSEKPAGTFEVGSNIAVEYVPSLVNENFVSLRFNISAYTAGAAHPNNFTIVFNYDLRTNKQPTLADFFKGDYLPELSKNAEEILTARFRQKRWGTIIKKGIAPTYENYKNVLVTEAGFVFIFDVYQVGPYSIGPQEITIPFDKLSSVLTFSIL